MRRLPKFIRVLGLRVPVTLETEPVINELTDSGDHIDTRVYGMYSPEYPGIVLDRDNGPERMKATLVHEAVHAMLNVGHIGGFEDEEVFVQTFSPLLHDFIRANRGVIAYLQES